MNNDHQFTNHAPGSINGEIQNLKACVALMKARIIENKLQHIFTPEEKQLINSLLNKR